MQIFSSPKSRYILLFVLSQTTSVSYASLQRFYGIAMFGNGIIDNMAINEKNIVEFTVKPTTLLACWPESMGGARPVCKNAGGYRVFSDGYRFLNIQSDEPGITFPDLEQLYPNTYVLKTNEYHRFDQMYLWDSTHSPVNICDTRSTGMACFTYSPTDVYRLRISAPGKPDGIYTTTFHIMTYYNAANTPIDTTEMNWAYKGTVTYRISNGSVVPPTAPVSCNFSRIYMDTSGTSSGTNILHIYGGMKPKTTDAKKTMLVYSCDQSASSFTATLSNAGISVNRTTASTSEVKTKTVVDDRTGKLDVELTGIKGPLPAHSISDKEFLIGFKSTLTARSAGSLKYTDVLVISYD